MARTQNVIAAVVQLEMTHALLHILSECLDFLMELELQIFSLANEAGLTDLRLYNACLSNSVP